MRNQARIPGVSHSGGVREDAGESLVGVGFRFSVIELLRHPLAPVRPRNDDVATLEVPTGSRPGSASHRGPPRHPSPREARRAGTWPDRAAPGLDRDRVLLRERGRRGLLVVRVRLDLVDGRRSGSRPAAVRGAGRGSSRLRSNASKTDRAPWSSFPELRRHEGLLAWDVHPITSRTAYDGGLCFQRSPIPRSCRSPRSARRSRAPSATTRS